MSEDSVERFARVANIERTMEVLEALCGHAHGLTVTELAAALKVPKGIVSRILATLVDTGYLVRDPLSNRFRVTFRFVSLGLRHVDQLGVEALYRPLIEALADETGELVHIAMVEGDDLRYIARAEGKNRVRVVSILGTKVVLHASGAGKVWLASLTPEEAIRHVMKDGMERRTSRTVTSIEGLKKELELARRQGYALNLGEADEGVSSVAAPIRVGKGPVIGAVSISGPSYRLPEARLKEYGRKLGQLGAELGEMLSIAPWAQEKKELAG
jgi:DNA-binding IclR family transcriptional regulator